MTQSHFLDYRAVIRNRADGYEWADDAYVNAETMDPAHEAPSGGVLATTGDVSKFVLALGDARLLSAQSWSLLWTPPPIDTPYALGFGVTPYEGRRRIGHNGAAVGFASAFSWFPEDKGGVIVLTNGYQEPFGRNVADFSFELARLSGVFSDGAGEE
jgi:CubicO group peptidase (beta-lactamase class C family)